MSIDRERAQEIVNQYLKRAEDEMNAFGSALPGHVDQPKYQLIILDDQTQEHDFGWVFFYTTREYIEKGDFSAALAGNAPLIIDKSGGQIYETGTAYPIDHYIDAYRAGIRTPIEQLRELPLNGDSHLEAGHAWRYFRKFGGGAMHLGQAILLIGISLIIGIPLGIWTQIPKWIIVTLSPVLALILINLIDCIIPLLERQKTTHEHDKG
ncbi:MAG: hypothetical protein JRF25_10950 [Deltaproteobacteria bacterium]|nr:hypothetical protein [Deltaproteobacteria bacterium]